MGQLIKICFMIIAIIIVVGFFLMNRFEFINLSGDYTKRCDKIWGQCKIIKNIK